MTVVSKYYNYIFCIFEAIRQLIQVYPKQDSGRKKGRRKNRKNKDKKRKKCYGQTNENNKQRCKDRKGNRKGNGNKKGNKEKKARAKRGIRQVNTEECISNGKLRKTGGIIRSHRGFPQYYDTHNMCSYFQLSLKLKKRAMSFSIVVKMYGICEYDTLKIKSGNWSENNFSSIFTENKFGEFVYTFNTDAAKDLSFTFNVDKTSQGCGGFIICYKGKTFRSHVNISSQDQTQV